MIEKPLFRRVMLALWIVSVAGTCWASLTPRLELPVDFWNADKLYHTLTYAWLGGLPLWAFATGGRARAAAYCMIPLGGLLEWGQSFVPGRTASMGDAVANALGVFLGIWIAEHLMARCRGCRGLDE
ncbi:VanZ family protein [Solidesulfovibrio sp.]|uniref:VanZ family protein n=1 Tax=Solidesulfovibrio sp. TaxID=2910990 RepID=UPI002628457C|nr:VanZ family protein [Solidesulfovibrio sp.]